MIQVEREKAASHSVDIRSLVCEQSPPSEEQSRSLELRHYRLVGPSVWKCTCRRAGLWLRKDIGGRAGFFSGPSVSCQFVWDLYSTQYLLTNIYCSLVCSPHLSSACLFYHLFTSSEFSSSYLLFPFSSSLLTTIVTLRPPPPSPHAVLHSSPPAFKCWWAAEQYPGGHGDRQPPPCGLFLLLSLVLLPFGSCTLLTAHILS